MRKKTLLNFLKYFATFLLIIRHTAMKNKSIFDTKIAFRLSKFFYNRNAIELNMSYSDRSKPRLVIDDKTSLKLK
jgi:hypothetical protein